MPQSEAYFTNFLHQEMLETIESLVALETGGDVSLTLMNACRAIAVGLSFRRN